MTGLFALGIGNQQILPVWYIELRKIMISEAVTN